MGIYRYHRVMEGHDNAVFMAVGVLLGGFLSWMITHENSRRAERLAGMKQRSASRLIDQPIDKVWAFASNPVWFKYFTLYDIPDEEVDEARIEPGAAFASRRMTDFVFITDFDPGKTISFGSEPITWDHYVHLESRGTQTLVYLSRRFAPYEARMGWFNTLLESLPWGPRGPMTVDELIRDTLDRFEYGIKAKGLSDTIERERRDVSD